MKKFISLLASLVIAIIPLVSFADNVSADEMKSICLDGFMKDTDKSSDPDAYKSYVNNMCACTGEKMGGKDVDQSAVMAGIGACMQLTLLTETMSNLKDEDTLTEDKIAATCKKEWQVFTSFKKEQGTLEKTCACAATKIMALDKDKRNDEDSLSQISMDCVGKDS